jgi:AraC family transcriptional regulator
MQLFRPMGVIAGFLALTPDPGVPELVHAGEFWAPNDWSIDNHVHDTWEFYFQERGETSWEAGNRAFKVGPGDLLAIPPHTVHRLLRRCDVRHHFFFAAIDLDKVLSRRPSLSPQWLRPRPFELKSVAHLQSSFRQLNQEICRHGAFRCLGLQLTTDYILIEISRMLLDKSRARSLATSHPAVRRALSLLDNAYQERWLLRDLARASGVSSHHLAEIFTKEIGIPPHRYLLNLRIERAKEVLRQDNVPITDLAISLGFASSQHFARAFKLATGVSAKAFRKTNG